jgi:hypothetical protein
MSHKEGTSAAIQAVTAVLRVGVGALAAYHWGLLGLAISSAALSVVMYAVMWHVARSIVGVRTDPTLRPKIRSLGLTEA